MSNEGFQVNKLFDVQAKVALVTGGGSGIGLMATQALAVNGAKVYIVGRTKEKLDRVVQTYGQGIAGEIIPLTYDISKKDQIASLAQEISSREKSLSVLINNAGISSNKFETQASTAEEMRKNLFDKEDATFEDWGNAYESHVTQTFFMTTAFLPLLQNASEHHHGYSGTIINVTSISGMVKVPQHHFAYNAAKSAAIHVTRMLASQCAENGLKIRINSLAPGVFPSEMTTDGSDESQKSHIPKEKFEGKIAAQRPGKDEDMANAILFLVTNQYMNGQNVAVDGGYTLASGL